MINGSKYLALKQKQKEELWAKKRDEKILTKLFSFFFSEIVSAIELKTSQRKNCLPKCGNIERRSLVKFITKISVGTQKKLYRWNTLPGNRFTAQCWFMKCAKNHWNSFNWIWRKKFLIVPPLGGENVLEQGSIV